MQLLYTLYILSNRNDFNIQKTKASAHQCSATTARNATKTLGNAVCIETSLYDRCLAVILCTNQGPLSTNTVFFFTILEDESKCAHVTCGYGQKCDEKTGICGTFIVPQLHIETNLSKRVQKHTSIRVQMQCTLYSKQSKRFQCSENCNCQISMQVLL